jgi:hypothetical protein
MTRPDWCSQTRGAGRQAVILNVASGIGTVVVVFVGVPAALIWAVGLPPFKSSNPEFASAHGLVDLLALVVWIAWLRCCYPLVCSVVRRVKQRDLSSTTRPLPLDRLGICIASAILILGSTATTVGDSAAGAVTKTTSPSRTGPLAMSESSPLSVEGSVRTIRVMPGHRRIPQEEPLSIGDRTPPSTAAYTRATGERVRSAQRVLSQAIEPRLRQVNPDQSTAVPALSRSLASRTEGAGSAYGGTDPKSSGDLSVQEFCAVGLGALGAAAIARRLRRRRAIGSSDADPEAADDTTVDMAVLVERFQDTPLLRWIETANVLLGRELARVSNSRDVPSCHLVCAGTTSIEFRLTISASWAPPGFELSPDGSAWNFLISRTLEGVPPEPPTGPPWIPILLPIGNNEDGTWLVGIPPGGCVSVLGPSASSLMSAMTLMADGWAWSGRLVVSSDPSRASSIIDADGAGRSGPDAQTVLFIGDPNAIDPKARLLCSVLTKSSDVPADTIVVVDDRSATLHPSGISVRPNGLAPPLADALTQLAEGTTALPEPFVVPGHSDEHPPALPSAAFRSHPQVEVRLLTAMPRIDGLQEALPPKRARRAIEVVAYLGLHRPDPVTSDRLRTRVLGTRESDAAAKTLFNTVGAARRALGLDSNGGQLLPPASKSGHYRLSELVAVDVVRSMSLCAAADDAENDETSMALYRAALDLVEGEPFSGTLAGYSWWRAEGYEAKISVVLVEAACRLSELAVNAGLLDLARWAVERGRMIDAYSELLSRSALTLAASSGDFARLRREWMECQRRVDELDPGCLPSQATTRLFAELSDRLSIVPI